MGLGFLIVVTDYSSPNVNGFAAFSNGKESSIDQARLTVCRRYKG